MEDIKCKFHNNKNKSKKEKALFLTDTIVSAYQLLNIGKISSHTDVYSLYYTEKFYSSSPWLQVFPHFQILLANWK